MTKKKTCSYCGEKVDKLWRSKPPVCMKYSCRGKDTQARQESRSEGTKIGNKTMYSWDKYKSKKNIAPFSKKKLDELAKYRPLRDEYLTANNQCEAQIEGVCIHGPVELHHRAPRAFHLCDTHIFLSVCRPCHRHIHDNSEWAFEKGFLLSKHGKEQE